MSEREALVKAGSSSKHHLKQTLRIDEENMNTLVVRVPCGWQQCAASAMWVRKCIKRILCKLIICLYIWDVLCQNMIIFHIYFLCYFCLVNQCSLGRYLRYKPVHNCVYADGLALCSPIIKGFKKRRTRCTLMNLWTNMNDLSKTDAFYYQIDLYPAVNNHYPFEYLPNVE